MSSPRNTSQYIQEILSQASPTVPKAPPLEEKSENSSWHMFALGSEMDSLLNRIKERHEQSCKVLDKSLEDFVIIDDFPPNAPYDVTQLTYLLNAIAKKQDFSCIETYKDNNFGDVCSLWKNASRQIVLFNLVKDTQEDLAYVGNHFISLQQALVLLKKRPHIAIEKIYIPVAGLIRNHYRLLEIDLKNNCAFYYDSKSYFVSTVANATSAAIETYNVLNKTQQHSSHEDKSLMDKTFKILDKTIEALQIFNKSYTHIETVLTSYMPQLTVKAVGLGHQDYNNHLDCGVYVAGYFELLLKGKDPSTATIDASALRLHHHELLTQSKIDFDYEPGMAANYRFY